MTEYAKNRHKNFFVLSKLFKKSLFLHVDAASQEKKTFPTRFRSNQKKNFLFLLHKEGSRKDLKIWHLEKNNFNSFFLFIDIFKSEKGGFWISLKSLKIPGHVFQLSPQSHLPNWQSSMACQYLFGSSWTWQTTTRCPCTTWRASWSWASRTGHKSDHVQRPWWIESKTREDLMNYGSQPNLKWSFHFK